MNAFRDLYADVGVAVDLDVDPTRITLNEINKAFQKTAKRYHPDKNPKGRDKFEAASTAVEVLRDLEKKKKYDDTFRTHQRELKRMETEDLRTKKMRHDLLHRERQSAERKREDNTSVELERLQRETLQFTQAARTVLPSLVKHFSLEEHLARERVILKMAMQQQQ